MKLEQRRSFLQTPAIRAMLILCVAFFVTFLIAQIVLPLVQIEVSPIGFAVLHGLLAAVLVRALKMPFWWCVILFFFPVAVILVNSLHLPPALFLGVFLFLLFLFWSTYRSQVPFYPSNLAVWSAVEALLPHDKPLRVIDIGSGLGGAILHLSAQRPDSQFVGIELAPLPWLVSRVRACFSKGNARFICGDYTRLDFSEYDVIFAYLSPAAMTALWQKASSEMSAGALLLSYEFPIDGAPAHIAEHPRAGGPVLYGWRM